MITGTWLCVTAACLQLLSGVPGLFGGPRSKAGPWLSAVVLTVAAIVGVAGLFLHAGPTITMPWGLPLGRFAVALDPLSAVFLVPVLVVPAAAAIYGLGYLPAPRGGGARRLRLALGLLAGAMAFVVLSRDGVLFLVAWETMALSGFLLVTAADDDAAVRWAGYVYLGAAHVGTAFLLAFFARWRAETGSFDLEPALVSGSGAGLLLVLGLVGFGVKAGLVPLHVWLPGAHANAPSHVSAVLSGVMLKLGVYGIARILLLLPNAPSWFGQTLFVVGGITALAAIAVAVGQSDLKRLLAYSSIENVGIIVMALGVAAIGRSTGHPALVTLGLTGGLLHVWNHALFKPALFFGAGAVVHATGTRDITRLGGLARRMPVTAAAFAGGAVAIAALPPMNGFVSEALLYVGLFRGATLSGEAGFVAFGAPVLAMVGALALVALVKGFGLTFLGEPRSEAARSAHEAPRTMRGAMVALVAACVTVGVVPWVATPAIDAVVVTFAPRISPVGSLVPLATLGAVSLGVLGLALGLFVLLDRRRRAGLGNVGTWDCGYLRPTERMQYTPASFGETTTRAFWWLMWPIRRTVRVTGAFPTPMAFDVRVPDPVLDRAVLPAGAALRRLSARLRVLQHGRLQIYVLYILAALLGLLLWS